MIKKISIILILIIASSKIEVKYHIRDKFSVPLHPADFITCLWAD